MALTVALFLGASLVIVVAPQVPAFDPLTYSPQTIERVLADGTVSVPTVEGFDPPAIRLGDRVPVRGTLTNDADHDVSATGTVVWTEDPPGRRFVVVTDAPSVVPVGVTQLRFENPIPAKVAEYVRENGPTRFAISGRVEVLEERGVDATWKTDTFLVVP